MMYPEEHKSIKAGITVIICCYNSATRLPQTLQHLSAQVVPENIAWEVIVVNNASKDDTVAIAKNTWSSYSAQGVPLRVVDEMQPGQVYARKKGVQEARYEYLVFCDDDNWLSPAYVATAWKVMTTDPNIGAAGGQNHPVTENGLHPDWFDEYKDKYATGVPAKTSGDVTPRGFILGAGMVTRRSLFIEMYDERYPSLLNGRNGEKLSTGDDFEYCKRLMLRGYTLYYDENMYLEHFIPKERLTVAYRDRLMDGIIDAGKILEEYDLAVRVYRRKKHKNRWRMLLLTPMRIKFSQWGWNDRVEIDERLTMFYFSPFTSSRQPVKTAIKKFIFKQ